jgi:hypothetical protein
MRFPRRGVKLPLSVFRRFLPLVPAAGVALALGACAPRGCNDSDVLARLDDIDRQADLAHVGLLGDARISPVADPRGEMCSIWEVRRNPLAGAPREPRFVLRPQSFLLTEASTGWSLLPVPRDDAPVSNVPGWRR